MKIVGKVEVQGYTRVEDLDEGDVFCFCDDNEVYMKTSEDYIVSLENGKLTDYEEYDYYNRPVRTLKTHLVIE